MENHQLVNQDSGNVEWYTPPYIIEAARETLGEIELDPFSCWQANRTVLAREIFTKDDNGFLKSWNGKKVWCNHPFSRENNSRIADKVISEYQQGSEIVMITFAATSENWFRPLLGFPQCFLHGRTNYIDQKGNKVKGVTKGSVVTYLGYNLDSFYQSFSKIGAVKVVYGGCN